MKTFLCTIITNVDLKFGYVIIRRIIKSTHLEYENINIHSKSDLEPGKFEIVTRRAPRHTF